MNINWTQYMSEASDEDVLDYVRDFRRYETAAVEAAILELANRGTIIPQGKIDLIRSYSLELDRKEKEVAEEVNLTESLMSGNLDHMATTNPAAPLFYSKKSIYIFSILFSTMFGAFMLAANIERTKARKGFLVTAIFGFLYPAIVWFAMDELGTSNKYLVMVFNIIGAFIINGILWPQFIGKAMPYQKRAPIYPIIFAVILVIVIVVLVLLTV